jgi:hypothetical protein
VFDVVFDVGIDVSAYLVYVYYIFVSLTEYETFLDILEGIFGQIYRSFKNVHYALLLAFQKKKSSKSNNSENK